MSAAISGADASGILRGALAGGITAGVAFGAQGLDLYLKVAAIGVAGGIASVIQGGKFGHGFVSGAISTYAGNKLTFAKGPISRGLKAAVIGGTVSKATGGKFANGAVSAAFAYAVSAASSSLSDNSNNAEHKKNIHTRNGRSPHGKNSFTKEKIAEIDAKLDNVRGRLVGTSPNGGSDIVSHNSAVALTNDAELIGISKEYDIEVSARLGTDGTIKSIDTIYHHSSAGNTAQGNESLWHTHPGRAFKNNLIGERVDMRSLSMGDILNNRNWKYAAYFDGSIVAMQMDSPVEWLYENGEWAKTGKLKRVH